MVREIEATGRHRFAFWLLAVAILAFAGALFWRAQRSGAGITFAGKTIVRPR